MGKGINKVKAELKIERRRFLGKLTGFEDVYTEGNINLTSEPKEGDRKLIITAKRVQALEQRHLKAYLKGCSRFSFGKDNQGNPTYFPVLQSFEPIELTKPTEETNG